MIAHRHDIDTGIEHLLEMLSGNAEAARSFLAVGYDEIVIAPMFIEILLHHSEARPGKDVPDVSQTPVYKCTSFGPCSVSENAASDTFDGAMILDEYDCHIVTHL